jgi:hypothetical protein
MSNWKLKSNANDFEDPWILRLKVLEVEGYDLWHMSAAEAALQPSKIIWEWNTIDGVLAEPMESDVAFFFRPMYLYGYYTESKIEY